MEIKLAETDEEIAGCFPVMVQLRPALVETEFVARVRDLQKKGYLLVFLSEGGVKAVAGFRLMDMLVSGPLMYVDDLVTDAASRSQGHGDRLFDWLREYAQTHGCGHLKLDSGVQRADAHRFYFRKRMTITSYHFAVPVEAQP